MTNSGNWTEVVGLKEKTSASKRNNNTRISLNAIFLIIALLVGLFILLMGLTTGKMSFTPMILVPVGGYYLYRYMQRDLGTKYKIPIFKISSIELKHEEKKVILHFFNGSDEIDQQSLMNVENKGFEILTGLDLKQ
jgi:hypothetical protein